MTSYYYVGSWFLLKPNRMVMMWQSVVKGLCQVQGKHVPLHLHNRHQSVSCLSNIVFWNLSNKCFGSLCVTNCVRDKCASFTIVCIFLHWLNWVNTKQICVVPARQVLASPEVLRYVHCTHSWQSFYYSQMKATIPLLEQVDCCRWKSSECKKIQESRS